MDKQKLVSLIKSYEKVNINFEYCVTEHVRVSGIYWGLNTTHLIEYPESLSRESTVEFVLKCQQENGGFAGNIGEDANLLHTLSALQILLLFNSLNPNTIDYSLVVNYTLSLLQSDGSFINDKWSDKDTKSTYCAILILSLLNKLNVLEETTINSITNQLIACSNWDGGFGSIPNTESHSGQIFCSVAALSLLGKLDLLGGNKRKLELWLSDRQLSSGGLNGRPGKQHDTCYSWWVLASLKILGCNLDQAINVPKCIEYILLTEDQTVGGFAPRPKERPDIFHTHFAVAGLSLLGYPDVIEIDPICCLPKAALESYRKIL